MRRLSIGPLRSEIEAQGPSTQSYTTHLICITLGDTMNRRHRRELLEHEAQRDLHQQLINTQELIATRRVLRTKQILRLHHLTQLLERPANENTPRRPRHHPFPLGASEPNPQPAPKFDKRLSYSLYQSPWTVIAPARVHTCIRRKQRREVLHALRRTGKGAKSRRTYKPESYYICK